MSRERTAADHEDRMSSPLGSKNIVNLKAMSGSEDGLDRERSTSVQVNKNILIYQKFVDQIAKYIPKILNFIRLATASRNRRTGSPCTKSKPQWRRSTKDK